MDMLKAPDNMLNDVVRIHFKVRYTPISKDEFELILSHKYRIKNN